MSDPNELSIAEIRRYMLENGCKVTNHALVKHFKRFLTKPLTQEEARKQFKTYVNILATIKNENNQKYLVLRKKFIEECPSEELVRNSLAPDATPSSPGGYSTASETAGASPFRQPPPYKPPPEVSTPLNNKQTSFFPTSPELDYSNNTTIKQDIDGNNSIQKSISNEIINVPLMKGENVQVKSQANIKGEKIKKQISRSDSNEEPNNKENIERFSFSSGSSTTSGESSKDSKDEKESTPNTISVKEATRKFNRMASEEEAKIISPPIKKKPEKPLQEKEQTEVSYNHKKAKEWIVAMSKANYQELHSLANDYPELVKLKDPATGYNALHWAAKHGDADVIKLIAGTHNLDVNSRTNGGYTPLHLAIQFGRENICELLWNTYKANRDLMDYSGNKPMDYNRQRTSVSDSTCSKIIARRKHAAEKDLGFLRIGSLNVRVKKTTEAFSNFLDPKKSSQRLRTHVHNGTIPNPSLHHHPHLRHHHTKLMTETLPIRASAPIKTDLIKFDVLHKSWGSADNIPQKNNNDLNKMPPPRSQSNNSKKRTKSSKRSSLASDSTSDSISTSTSSSNLNEGYSSMPTTPNQYRAIIGLQNNHLSNLEDSDSDSACGFNSTWRENGQNMLKNNNYSPVP